MKLFTNWSIEQEIIFIVILAIVAFIIIAIISFYASNKQKIKLNKTKKEEIKNNVISNLINEVNAPINVVGKAAYVEIKSDLAKLSVTDLKKLANYKKINIDNVKIKSELIKKLENLNSKDLVNFMKIINNKKHINNSHVRVKRLLNVLNLPILKELARKENIKLLTIDTKPIIIEKLKNIDFIKVKELVNEKEKTTPKTKINKINDNISGSVENFV